MKILTILLLFTFNGAFAQSYLYSKEGKLLLDSTYRIDKNSYENLKIIENQLLPAVFNKLKYPEIAKKQNIEGIVIVKISANASAKSFNFSIEKSSNKIFNEVTNESFGNLSAEMKKQIMPQQGDIIIYVPIKFTIDKQFFYQSIYRNKALTIETKDIAVPIFIHSYHWDK